MRQGSGKFDSHLVLPLLRILLNTQCPLALLQRLTRTTEFVSPVCYCYRSRTAAMRVSDYSFTLLSLVSWIHAQEFNIYPNVSPDGLAQAFNISLDCLTALNTTVQCDQDLFTMVGNVDGYFWSDDNATALCTSTCQASAASWFTNAGDACADDNLSAYGRVW